MSYEEEDTCMSYEEEDTCMSYEEEDIYEEEDTCMSYEEEDTCLGLTRSLDVSLSPCSFFHFSFVVVPFFFSGSLSLFPFFPFGFS